VDLDAAVEPAKPVRPRREVRRGDGIMMNGAIRACKKILPGFLALTLACGPAEEEFVDTPENLEESRPQSTSQPLPQQRIGPEPDR